MVRWGRGEATIRRQQRLNNAHCDGTLTVRPSPHRKVVQRRRRAHGPAHVCQRVAGEPTPLVDRPLEPHGLVPHEPHVHCPGRQARFGHDVRQHEEGRAPQRGLDRRAGGHEEGRVHEADSPGPGEEDVEAGGREGGRPLVRGGGR